METIDIVDGQSFVIGECTVKVRDVGAYCYLNNSKSTNTLVFTQFKLSREDLLKVGGQLTDRGGSFPEFNTKESLAKVIVYLQNLAKKQDFFYSDGTPLISLKEGQWYKNPCMGQYGQKVYTRTKSVEVIKSGEHHYNSIIFDAYAGDDLIIREETFTQANDSFDKKMIEMDNSLFKEKKECPLIPGVWYYSTKWVQMTAAKFDKLNTIGEFTYSERIRRNSDKIKYCNDESSTVTDKQDWSSFTKVDQEYLNKHLPLTHPDNKTVIEKTVAEESIPRYVKWVNYIGTGNTGQMCHKDTFIIHKIFDTSKDFPPAGVFSSSLSDWKKHLSEGYYKQNYQSATEEDYNNYYSKSTDPIVPINKPLDLKGRYLLVLDDSYIQHYPCIKGDYMLFNRQSADIEYWGESNKRSNYYGPKTHKNSQFKLMPEGFQPPIQPVPPSLVSRVIQWTQNMKGLGGKYDIIINDDFFSQCIHLKEYGSCSRGRLVDDLIIMPEGFIIPPSIISNPCAEIPLSISSNLVQKKRNSPQIIDTLPIKKRVLI